MNYVLLPDLFLFVILSIFLLEMFQKWEFLMSSDNMFKNGSTYTDQNHNQNNINCNIISQNNKPE